MSKPYQIVAKTGKTPVVMLHGYIGNDEPINAQQFMADFDAATADSEDVIFNINSGGGSVIEGFAIYDMVKARKKRITAQVFGMAGSMGFVMMLLGDTIQISANSNILVHRVSRWAGGDADQLVEAAKKCREFETRIIAITVARSKQTEDVVKTWFKTGYDKWFNATEAVAAGLADEIIGQEISPPLVQNLKEQEVYNRFYNHTAHKTPNNSNPIFKKMTTEQLKLLNLPADATDAQAEAAIKNLVTKVSELEAKVESQEKQAAEDLFVELGLPENKKPEFLNACKKLGAMDAKSLFKSLHLQPPGDSAGNQQPPKTSINDAIKAAADKQQNREDRSGWTFTEWAKKDPAGLKNMTEEQRNHLKSK